MPRLKSSKDDQKESSGNPISLSAPANPRPWSKPQKIKVQPAPCQNPPNKKVIKNVIMPNRLFRYDGQRWTKMEDNVRVNMSNTDTKNTQKGTFINNSTTSNIGGETVKERQPVSKALKPRSDN